MVNVEQQTYTEGPDGAVFTHILKSSPSPSAELPGRSMTGLFQRKRNVAAHQDSRSNDVVALSRLARDLSISTPCILPSLIFSTVSLLHSLHLNER